MADPHPEAAVPAGGPPASAVVEVEYFTDPLCSWSWAFEPQWRRLRFEFRGRLAWRYRMGGMIADWDTYSDPVNVVSRPLQMGPQWFQVRHLTGMPLDDRIWLEDPPASSYPACLAVKAAELQSPEAAEHYLRRLREAVMLQRRNIARREVLAELAGELARDRPGCLDPDRFVQDLDGPEAVEAFRQDLQVVRYRELGRFPTLVLRRGDGPGLLLVGYRPYDALLAALRHLAPDLGPPRPVAGREEYADYWGSLTDRELAEALPVGQDADPAPRPASP